MDIKRKEAWAAYRKARDAYTHSLHNENKKTIQTRLAEYRTAGDNLEAIRHAYTPKQP